MKSKRKRDGMRVMLLGLAAAGTLAAAPLAAQQSVSVAQLPPAGRAVFAENAQTCRDFEGGRLTAGPDFARRVELNGDGKPDFLLSIEGLECSSAASLLCGGSAGCEYEVLLSGAASGYRRIPLGTIQGIEILPGRGPARLRLGLHGSDCGRTGADTCYKILAWNGTRFAEVKGR